MHPPKTQLVIPQWLALPMPVRLHLKKVFGIPRSEGTNVVDGKVVSDGHTHPDLAYITTEGMEAYLGLELVPGFEPDFHKLFSMVLLKADIEMNPTGPVQFYDDPAPGHLTTEEMAVLMPLVDDSTTVITLVDAPVEASSTETITVPAKKARKPRGPNKPK